MRKRIALALAAVLLAVAALPMVTAALAETAATPTYDSGDYTYILRADDSAEIVDWEGEGEVLEIPCELDGHAVTAIGECAFADCAGLNSVVLPETIVEIGDQAFCGCAGLTDIVLPDNVAMMGVNPFADCANLVDIFVSPDAPYLATIEGVLFTKPDKRLVCYPMGLTAERYEVPDGVAEIGGAAFAGNLCLESVKVPDSVTEIAGDAFDGCEALAGLELPEVKEAAGESAVEQGVAA